MIPKIEPPLVVASSSCAVESAYTACDPATFVGAVPSAGQIAPAVPNVVQVCAEPSASGSVVETTVPLSMTVDAAKAPFVLLVLISAFAVVGKALADGTAVPPLTFESRVALAWVAMFPKGMPVGRSPVAKALNAGAPAVANKAWVVVVSAPIVELACKPPPITTALLVNAAALVTQVAQPIVPLVLNGPPVIGLEVATLVTVPGALA